MSYSMASKVLLFFIDRFFKKIFKEQHQFLFCFLYNKNIDQKLFFKHHQTKTNKDTGQIKLYIYLTELH